MNVGFIDVLIIITVLFNNYYVIYTDFNYCRNEPEVRAIGSTVGCQASWKTCFYKGGERSFGAAFTHSGDVVVDP